MELTRFLPIVLSSIGLVAFAAPTAILALASVRPDFDTSRKVLFWPFFTVSLTLNVFGALARTSACAECAATPSRPTDNAIATKARTARFITTPIGFVSGNTSPPSEISSTTRITTI